jgi:alkylated DNA repair dioxygenase AlkB
MEVKEASQLRFRFRDADTPEFTEFDLPDAQITFFPRVFNKDECSQILQQLSTTINWRQDHIKYYGKTIPLPRLTAWYGDRGKSYTYSNITMETEPWTPSLERVKFATEKVAGAAFNSVLLNLYRDGQDGVSWHQDNEPELGPEPTIASVSFGESRRFQFRHRYNKDLPRLGVDLHDGSILLMRGPTQQFWQHQIPKTSKPVGARINLTFRVIL